MSVVEQAERYLRQLVTFSYSWLSSDGEVLGYILGVWHFVISITILVAVFISHTLYPVIWFQFLVFLCLVIIWIQHIFLKVCISIVAEKKLTSKEPPFYEIIRNLLHIDPDTFTMNLIVAETSYCDCFGNH